MTKTNNNKSYFHVFSSLFILSLLLVCSAACQWGIQEVSSLDGETDMEDIDAAEGVEMDVIVDREEGVDDPDVIVPDVDDAEDAADMDAMDADDAQDAMDVDAELEAGCTSNDDCDDLEPCNGDETCGDDGECYDSSPLDDGTPCTDSEGRSGVCIEEVCDTSGCGNGMVEDGEDCDDGNDVEGDGCENDCTFTCGSAADCDDEEICTTDSCVENENGRICSYENLTIACNDNDECTVNDVCADGACGGDDRVCDDDDVCTDNGCDSETGCTYTPNTASCDDGDACTNPDQCDGAGECVGTGFVCACVTIDDCVVHDDGNFCNGIYICDDDNFCKTDPDTVVECDDSGDTECAKNTCDPDSGDCNMVDEEDGTECTDDSVCTQGDECTDGECIPGELIDCDDVNVCTDDWCDPVDSCQHTNNTDTCDDLLFCTLTDVCDGDGSCVGSGDTCDDDITCTTDLCIEDGDTCSNLINSGFCLIGGECIAHGTVNPGNECEECNESISQTAWSPKSGGTTCGDPADTECDNPDTCDGDGTCQDNYEGSGTSCGDSGDTQCDNPDTCNGSGTCQDNYEGSGTLCGDTGDTECDNPDTCNGSGTCQDNYEGSGTLCGDTGDTDCDNPDTCNGSGSCQDNYEGSGTLCGDTGDTDCDNPDTCNGSGTCLDNYEGSGTSCGDTGDTECTNPDTCDDSGNCQDNHETPGTSCGSSDDTECDNPDTCDDAGACLDNYEGSGTSCGDPTDTDCDNPDTCDGTGGCQDNYEPDGTPCPVGDGIDCTDDLCNGTGTCVITPDDMNCAPLSLCLPDCRLDATGCVPIPEYLDLTCTTPVMPPATSGCTIDLDGLTGQLNCLSCSSEVGMVEIDFSDFELGGAGCDLDGWTIVPDTGNQCSRNVGTHPACTQSAAMERCCDNMNAICHNIDGSDVLRSDDDLCREQWRLYKSFDTTGLSNLELCFDFGESGATDNEGLLVYISDSGHADELVFCEYTPRDDVDGFMYPQCVSLAAYDWANNNPDLVIMFLAHSEQDNDEIYLDNVRLKGWVSSCPPTYPEVLNDNFNACNLGAWTVTGAPVCPGTWNCDGSSLQTSVSSSWTIERQVDVSSLDGNVKLCFDYGDQGGGFAESIDVDFDAQRGAGWQSAWSQADDDLGTDATCMQICVNLSDINSDVNRNPDLLIRFSLAAGAFGTYNLDNVIVSGAQYCDGSGTVTLSAIAELGAGLYGFTAADDAGNRLDADINCTWDTPPTPVEDWETVNFIPVP